MDHNDNVLRKALELLALDLPRHGEALHIGWEGATSQWWARVGSTTIRGDTLAAVLVESAHVLGVE
jgi:hypothetical protein